MERCQVLDLNRVSEPNINSKHVVICIAGFLSEDIDKTEEWQNVKLWFKHAQVYALTWTSCAMRDFFDQYSLKKEGK